MILKYKYHSDTGLLEAYRSYTLAQNNSLSDTILITSTAPDAERYNYCLEFICYNSKSIPKAQYISPILNYSDEGISFVVPNNLTEFRGHVDMQLTGYDPDDNSIVFKSVSKNCKAFEVEGSLCVLEKDLNDTPNVFTEVLKQLEELGKIHQDIIDEAMIRFSQQMLTMVRNIKWYKVKFYDYGKLLDERWIVEGGKLTAPQYTLPSDCAIVGGWYNPAAGEIWDMENDTVQSDTDLYLNYITDEIVIVNGEVTDLGKHSRADIYIPEYYGGCKVTAVNVEPIFTTRVHLGHNMQDIGQLALSLRVAGLYFPENHEVYISDGGSIYAYDNLLKLIYAPKVWRDDAIIVKDGCRILGAYSIYNDKYLRRLLLPQSLECIDQYCIVNTGLESLRLPCNIIEVHDYAVSNNFNLKRVYIEGDVPEGISDETFINIDENDDVTRPILCVNPQYYENYKALNLAYEIQAVGQEYLDGRYAQKGE
ncbi:MAG: leucine-rich repeat domain-containing protein [Clostridia bacterium]|nr:leucine-rich repeat domain-containing protein [Clostridia bacterium]